MPYATTRGICKLICCQNSPEDLPYSLSTLWGVLILSALWQFLGIAGHLGPIHGLIWALVPIAVMAGFLAFTLRVRGQMERFVKIFLALQGANLLIEVIIWLTLMVVPYRMLVALVGGFWQLAVMGHILQYGLGISRLRGALLALAFIVGLGMVMMPAILALNPGISGTA